MEEQQEPQVQDQHQHEQEEQEEQHDQHEQGEQESELEPEQQFQQTPTHTDQHARMRVKLYVLSAQDNTWVDKGTGRGSCKFNEDRTEGTLVVHAEDNNEILLTSKVRIGENIYQRQQETLVVWSEEDGRDLALSFQEVEGCAEIWDNINEVQQHYAEDLFSDPAENGGADIHDTTTLPEPELSNLAEIEMIVKSVQISMLDKERLAAFIIADGFIDKLIPLLEECEDLEDLADLHLLHNILMGIVLLNDITIFQHIIRDNLMLGCIGILEYDPDFPEKENYRELFHVRSKFKQVVPIRDSEMEQKIQQTFRLHFLKDTVLTRIIDDHTFSILNSLIFFNNMDILNYFQQDRAFLKELFGIMEQESETLERKRDVVRFVQQYCSIAKTTQLPSRNGLYRTLSQSGLFNIFEPSLADALPRIRMAGAEILSCVLEHDPNLVRTYIVKQSQDKKSANLLDVIVNQFLAEEDSGIKLQFAEVIRILLDTNTGVAENGAQVLDGPTALDPDADKFLELFYSNYVAKFVSPMMDLTEDALTLDRSMAALCENICQVLSFMVRHHSFRSKYYVLSCGIVTKVCLLLKCRDKHLQLAALRFFRTCIGMNDEFYYRYLMKQNVFQFVVDAFVSTEHRNNLLNSVCIEFFDYIRRENIKSLIAHIVPAFADKFENVEYVDTFKLMIRRYETQQDMTSVNAETATIATQDAAEKANVARQGAGDAWSSATVDDEEEAYFNEDDDDEDDSVPDQGDVSVDVTQLIANATAMKESAFKQLGGDEPRTDSAAMTVGKSEPTDTSIPQAKKLLARSLVEYQEDDSDEDGEAGGSQSSSNGDKPEARAGKGPPEKRTKLDPDGEEKAPLIQVNRFESVPVAESTGSASGADRTGDQSKLTVGPIKFKLNKTGLKRSRSPSPAPTSAAGLLSGEGPLASPSSSSSSPSPTTRSRSLSPLPGMAVVSTSTTSPRSGIVFVKAEGDGTTLSTSPGSKSPSESLPTQGRRGSAELDLTTPKIAAANLRTEIATEEARRELKDKGEADDEAAEERRHGTLKPIAHTVTKEAVNGGSRPSTHPKSTTASTLTIEEPPSLPSNNETKANVDGEAVGHDVTNGHDSTDSSLHHHPSTPSPTPAVSSQ